MTDTNMTDSVLDLLKSHTSVREYTDRPVDEATRTAILEAAFAASSSCFLHLVTVIRVTDPEKRRALFEASGTQPQVLSAPEFWVFCADYHRNQKLCAEADLGWTEQLVTGTLDVGICVQNAMTALEALGLGGCFIGGLRNHIADADRMLELPEQVYPVLGLPLSVTVMENRYEEADPEALAAYDAVTEKYFATRSRSPREDSWSRGIEGVMKRERRTFMLDYLRSKGFALK